MCDATLLAIFRLMEYRVLVHEEDGAYWGEVEGLPGCFASGKTLDELAEAIMEAIALYLSDDDGAGLPSGHVDEMRVLIPA